MDTEERAPLAALARRRAARVWSFRMRAEHDATLRFSRLAERLSGSGAHGAVVTMARSAAADERRHTDLCGDLVAHLGGAPPELPSAPPREVAPSGLTARERVLYEVVALSCITETLSTALLGAIEEASTDSLVTHTAHSILRDEVQHSRLGWAHLAAEKGRGAGPTIAEYLPAMLQGTVNDELFADGEEGPEAAALSGLGALQRAERLSVFSETLRSVVFPGLETLGIDPAAGRAWLADRLRAP